MLFTVPVLEGGTAKAAGKDVVPDDNLRKELAAMGGIDESEVTKEYLAGLNTIMVSYEVNDLTGIEYCTNVDYISISGGFGSKVDLSKLSGLKKLQMLFISGVKSNDYTPLALLPNLERLDISYSDVTTLPDMSNTKLEIINVSSCKSLTDIKGISGCNNLEIAYLDGSAVTDISPLKGKSNLTYLDLDQIKITDANKAGYMSTISSLTNLEDLHMGWCGVSDEHLSMFDGLSKIVRLGLWDNNISDPSFLVAHKNTLEYVNIGGNPIADGSELAKLTGIKNIGVDSTYITDFSFVGKMTGLDNSNTGFVSSWYNYNSVCTYNRIDDKETTGAGVYKIKNKVKDHNGKYVAPVASDKYTYDSTTNEILIKLDEYGESYYGNVIFNIDLKSPRGDNLYASHRLEYQIYNAQPLKITLQPESQKVKPGEDVRFEVNAEGEEPLVYQWYKDGNEILMATSRILNVYDVEQDDAGEYYVVVSDRYDNEVTSDKVKLSLNVVPLVITTQPEDVTVDEGDEISFSVAATGDGTLTYQWYKDGNPIAGATTNTYTEKNVDEKAIGEYYVEVSDGYETIESDKVQANVNLNPLKITTQPKSVTVGEEKTATLSVTATAGKGTLTYQWYKDGNPIAGATAATLEIADASASDEGKDHVIVKDARETVKSTEVSVTVELIPLEITAQPIGANLKEDATASLKVTATGKGALTYQWYKDGNPIAGAAAATLEIADASASDEGK
ncbi:MAG: immunoglobulin domain-containing protein, partial [Lachnospiraceae bacterium]|nr:immunoglobulin domain-containing protein [Lachnospiraceae bacterium]